MIRVTIHMRDGDRFSTDDVQTVRQLVPGNGRKDEVLAACGEEILSFNFVPWRTTTVVSKAKTFTVASYRIGAIEAELITKENDRKGEEYAGA